MIVVYLFASVLGALATFVALSAHGSVIALLCAPWGGSVVAALVAFGMCVLRAEQASVEPGALTNQTT